MKATIQELRMTLIDALKNMNLEKTALLTRQVNYQ